MKLIIVALVIGGGVLLFGGQINRAIIYYQVQQAVNEHNHEVDRLNRFSNFLETHPEAKGLCSPYCPDWYRAQHPELQEE